jgi:hypothetical protein
VVVEFSLVDLRNPGAPEELTVEWEPAAGGGPARALIVHLKAGVRRPGTYTAWIAPLPKSAAAERLRLQIAIKPAKLVVPQKLVISRTIGLMLSVTEVKPLFNVHEDSKSTGIQKLTVTRTTAFSGNVALAQGLTPDPENKGVSVPAGQRAAIPYILDDHLPLGSVTGALRLAALELPEALSVDYDIQTRLSNVFIPLVTILGFFAGWLVRKQLVDIAALGEAREGAKEILVKVDQSVAERPDRTFRAAVKLLRDDLDAKRKGKKTTEVADAIKALDDGWRTALINFEKRKKEIADLIGELKSLAGPPLPLPPQTADRLAKARETVARAEKAIALNDVAMADDETKAEARLTDEIWKIGLAWQEQVAGLVRLLQTTPVGLPAAVQTQFVERSRDVPFDRLKPNMTFETPALRRALFIEFHTEARDARVLLSELSTRLEFEWNAIAKVLESVRPKLLPEYNQLADSIMAFQRELERAADDPDAFKAALPKRLQELDAVWRAVLIGKLPATTHPDKIKALTSLADSHQYPQLARELVGVFSTFLGAAPTGRDVLEAPWLTKSIDALQPPAAQSVPVNAATTPEPADPLTPTEARLFQSVILAMIYVAVYWVLNADGFGNSIADIAAIFVTSFGVDLSADTIMKLKK